MTEKSKASVKLIVRATAVGLQAKFDANLARHASALYDYGRTHTSRMHVQWLFNVHNSLQVLHARIINERCSCASKEFTVTYIKSSKNTQNQTNKYVLYHINMGGIEHTGQEGSRYQSIIFPNSFSCKRSKIESDIYILGVRRRRIILTRSTHLKLKAYT